MEIVFDIIALIIAIVAVIFFLRLVSALAAGKCPECGNRWTDMDKKTNRDNHRPNGLYMTTFCKCGKCGHSWNHSEKFVQDDPGGFPYNKR